MLASGHTVLLWAAGRGPRVASGGSGLLCAGLGVSSAPCHPNFTPPPADRIPGDAERRV